MLPQQQIDLLKRKHAVSSLHKQLSVIKLERSFNSKTMQCLCM